MNVSVHNHGTHPGGVCWLDRERFQPVARLSVAEIKAPLPRNPPAVDVRASQSNTSV